MSRPVRARRWIGAGLLALVAGCPASPEAGRGRGGGVGADVGNVPARPLATVPSKITDTKDLSRFRPKVAASSPVPIRGSETPARAGSR
jgi:hypothetical protein